jgi:glycosylphosphatidylinositol transamidase (GPIT) subunit GPI8
MIPLLHLHMRQAGTRKTCPDPNVYSRMTSNVLIFMTGRGGHDFLNFQDAEEIGAQDIADAIGQMYEKKRCVLR